MKLFLFFLLVVAAVVDSAVVFDNSAGTTADACAIQHMIKSKCDTCVNNVNQLATENERCAVQAQGTCKNFPEFVNNMVADYWLTCINKQRINNDPAQSIYSPRWVAKTDVWRLFPPFVSNDYNYFAGTQPVNCTCNQPYLLSPSSIVSGQSVIGSPTSWAAAQECGNAVIVHVGVRNLLSTKANDGWIKRDAFTAATGQTRDNIIVRILRSSGVPSFTNPAAWQSYTYDSKYAGIPGLPPISFPPGPGAFYYGWMAYLTEPNLYYYAWLVDGAMVCLDHLTGCNGLVDIPGTSVEAKTHGFLASVERTVFDVTVGKDTSKVKQLKYTWRRACAAVPQASVVVAPLRVGTSCPQPVGQTATCLSGAVNGIGGCQEFTQYLESDHAVSFDNAGKGQGCITYDASIQFLNATDTSASPIRPGFLGVTSASGQCIGWRGPMYKCVSCPNAFELCSPAADSTAACSSSNACWKDPANACKCTRCPATLDCYGNDYKWDPKVCRCVPCVRPACGLATCKDNSGTCTYPNLSKPCDTACYNCQTFNCQNGHKTPISPFYPASCMPCADCEDDAGKRRDCEFNTNGVRVGYYLYDANAKACKCLQCGPPAGDPWWAANGITQPAPADIFTPQCKPGSYATNILKPSFSNTNSQIGNGYYDPNVNRCVCQGCRPLWSDPNIMGQSLRLDDGTCALEGYTASMSNDCALCYKCAECADGWQVVFNN